MAQPYDTAQKDAIREAKCCQEISGNQYTTQKFCANHCTTQTGARRDRRLEPLFSFF